MFLTYILGVAWLGVFGFSAVPVFLFYNMWSTCATMRSPIANITNIDSICVDVRQYGRRKNTGADGLIIIDLVEGEQMKMFKFLSPQESSHGTPHRARPAGPH